MNTIEDGKEVSCQFHLKLLAVFNKENSILRDDRDTIIIVTGMQQVTMD
jgi:hypothetical protein